MTIYERLCADRIDALKAKDEGRKNVTTWLIDACQKAAKAATKDGVAPSMSDELCLPAIQKCQKIAQEMVDTCPETRADLLNKYRAQLGYVKTYAPQMVTDTCEIAFLIGQSGFGLTDKRNLMPYLKKMNVDMKVAQKVLKDMIEEK